VSLAKYEVATLGASLSGEKMVPQLWLTLEGRIGGHGNHAF